MNHRPIIREIYSLCCRFGICDIISTNLFDQVHLRMQKSGRGSWRWLARVPLYETPPGSIMGSDVQQKNDISLWRSRSTKYHGPQPLALTKTLIDLSF